MATSPNSSISQYSVPSNWYNMWASEQRKNEWGIHITGLPQYRHNLDCAYVIKVPKGYHIKLTVNNFNIETRYVVAIVSIA